MPRTFQCQAAVDRMRRDYNKASHILTNMRASDHDFRAGKPLPFRLMHISEQKVAYLIYSCILQPFLYAEINFCSSIVVFHLL